MKKILLLLFIAPLCTQAQMPTPDSLAKAFVYSIQNGDKEAFSRIYPNRETMKEILIEMMGAGGQKLDSAQLEMLVGGMNEEYERMYNRVLNKLKSKAINGRMLRFGSVKLQSYQEEEIPGKSTTMYKGSILVSAGGKNYTLEVSEILEFKGAYYGIELVNVKPAVAVKPAKPVAPKKPVKKN
ncbi:MAG: hypothetical protein JNM68_04265 [Dinghuibacter sp.]|nr:hypothetical protein [Dinghuibacter sp.]